MLDAGLICHLGVVADGDPVVLPTAYGRDGDTLYLHGSSANGAFLAADGHRVCVTVTHTDGLVAARSVFSHSVNYRSAVIFGTATIVSGEDERWQALRLITDHLIPGRWAAARQPTAKEMAATAVISLPLTEASVKVRAGHAGRTSPPTTTLTCGPASCPSPSPSASRSPTRASATKSPSPPTSATAPTRRQSSHASMTIRN